MASALLAIIILLVLMLCVGLSLHFGGRYGLLSPAVVMPGYFAIRYFPGYVDYSVVNESAVALIAVLLCFVGWMLGSYFVNVTWLRFKTFRVQDREGTAALREYSYPKDLVIWTPIIVGALSVLLMFYFLGRVPLAYLLGDILSSSDISMHDARRMNTLNHRAGETTYFGQGYLRFLYLNIAPIFCCLYYFSRKVEGRSLTIPALLIAMFAIAAALNGQIIPLIRYLLFISCFAILVKIIMHGKVNYGYIIRFVGLGVLLIILVVFGYRYGQLLSGREFDNFFLDTFRRIFSVPTAALFDLFPSYYGFRHGATWINDISGFLPGSVMNFSYEVHYIVSGGWGFTMAPGLIASAYVNFGLASVFLCFFIFSTMAQFLFLVLVNSRNMESKLLSIYLSLNVSLAVGSDITLFLTPFITIFILLPVLWVSRNIFGRERFFISYKNGYAQNRQVGDEVKR